MAKAYVKGTELIGALLCGLPRLPPAKGRSNGGNAAATTDITAQTARLPLTKKGINSGWPTLFISDFCWL
ncbi:hypothetical protein MY014_52580 [Escherichia coli]|nr:hypothetical protein MY014_52580 [Escherichia coli]